MPTMVSMRDETPGVPDAPGWLLEILEDRVTVRELIRRRVFQEVQDHNSGTRSVRAFPSLAKGKRVDFREQFDLAIAAFERRQWLLLIDNRQFESLDDEIQMRPGLEATFLRLTPLVGG